ncbi:TonB-dependent receptor [Mucilaginibacter sp. PAMB04274]|uniref:SusC/RagA family TonB-linked outer membrane protein n=1 Tax=Mucilaginibacter sp. PAMB04274 TaxID=3138568 RepID=UPI0031F71461
MKQSSTFALTSRIFISTPVTWQILLLVCAFIVICSPAFSQAIIIKGTVSDETGTMAGVTVTLKTTRTATRTDAKGNYSISAPNRNAVLVFTFVGYENREIPIGSNNSIDVIMKSSANDLNDVVVIGYGTSKKRDLTGSVGSVNMKDIQKAAVTSVDGALAGRIAGVQVTSNDGQPGANAEILVRGVGSVSQSSAPLYVIDGFPQEDANFNSINPADIASIDVLKDASATAIYGARGSNGVILITTKKGTSGIPQLTFSTNSGFQKSINNVKLMDAYEFVKLQNDINPYFTSYVYFRNGKTLDSYKNAQTINWQDIMFNKLPAFQNHNVSLTGRSGKTSYAVSASYADQAGLIIKSGFKRYQARIVLDQEINDKLKIGINTNYADTKSYGSIPSVQANPTGNGQNLAAFNLMYNIWSYRPVLSSGLFDENFIYNDLVDNNEDGGLPGGNSSINPYINTSNVINDRLANTLTGNSYLEYKIIPGLQLRVTAGINLTNSLTNTFYNSRTQSGSPLTAAGAAFGVNGSTSAGKSISFINENTLSYSKNFNQNNILSALIGYSSQTSKNSGNGFSATNLPNESLGINGLGQGTPYRVSSSSSLSALQSYYGRLNYTYRKNYLFTANFRADGSSKFYKDNRWGYFPSGALAWRFSGENFMKKYSFIDDAKIRFSYGVIGNNRVADFAYLSQINTGSNIYYAYNDQNVYGSTVQTMSNYNLKWETTYESDLGINFSLFKGRLNFETDYYKRITKNLLLSAAMPYSTGFTTAFQNVGSVSNEGLEFTLATVNISKKNFTWSSSFNISFNRNRVLELTGGEESRLTTRSFESAMTTPNYIAKIGRPVAQFYGYVADGLYQLNDFYKIPNGTAGFYYVLKEGIPYYAGKNTLASPQTNQSLVVQPGDPKYKDINGDGLINGDDYTVIGNPYPLHYGGFSNNFSYKNFDLNVFLQWSYGNQVMNANKLKFEGNTNAPQSGNSPTTNLGSVNVNQFASYVNRWTPTNPTNEYPRANANTGGLRQYSTRIIEDASYLRLKTVSIGYNLPRKMLTRLHINNLRFSLSGQNLLTFTKYTGPDPEVSTNAGNNLAPGFDFSPYPRTRVLTFGANLTL